MTATPLTELQRAARREARDALWRAGDLAWMLDPTQLALYEAIKADESGFFATEGARKLGKSYAHGVIASEAGLQNAGKQVNWAAITGKECRLVLVPILEQISKTAPPECRGVYHSQNNQWRFPNGAWIQLIGADTREDCEKGRGPSSILNIVDEAGFHSHLEYLVESILSPQMRRVRRIAGSFVGMTLLVSTTPYTPAHPFCAMADAAEIRAAYRRLTIWDSGWESKEEIQRYIDSEARKKNMSTAEFMATTHFRREYLSERVVDEEMVVFPEFVRKRDAIVRESPRPMGFDKHIYRHVAIDQGGTRDAYGLLFAHNDFIRAKLVIEDELLLAKPNTAQVAAAIDDKETKLWPEANPQRVTRVIDDPLGRLVLDLWDLHKIRTQKATKHDRDSSINMVRTLINSERLEIHPRCINLRKQLLNATPNKAHTDFERTRDGHSDLAAALMYLVRDADLTRNPYPDEMDVATGRALPAHHPLVARREALGGPPQGLRGAFLANNRWVAGQRRR